MTSYLIYGHWTSAVRMQLKLGKMDPYRLKFIFKNQTNLVYKIFFGTVERWMVGRWMVYGDW